MAYSEELAARIRTHLKHLPDVQEKKMFGSLGFMVNGKLCVTAGPGRMMCRTDPEHHQGTLQRSDCEPVFMKGRAYKGYFYVPEKNLDEATLKFWIQQALQLNRKLSGLNPD